MHRSVFLSPLSRLPSPWVLKPQPSNKLSPWCCSFFLRKSLPQAHGIDVTVRSVSILHPSRSQDERMAAVCSGGSLSFGFVMGSPFPLFDEIGGRQNRSLPTIRLFACTHDFVLKLLSVSLSSAAVMDATQQPYCTCWTGGSTLQRCVSSERRDRRAFPEVVA